MTLSNEQIHALRLRGDAAWTLLAAMQASMLELHKAVGTMNDTLQKALAANKDFDTQHGVSVGTSPKQELLNTIRASNPAFASLSDDAIMAMFKEPDNATKL